MIPRLVILIALVFAALSGERGASWAQDDAGHGPCGMAGAAEAGHAVAGGCSDDAGDAAADGAGVPCAMAAACGAVPPVATAAGLTPPVAETARTAPIRSDRLPDGRASKPSLEPPIARG